MNGLHIAWFAYPLTEDYVNILGIELGSSTVQQAAEAVFQEPVLDWQGKVVNQRFSVRYLMCVWVEYMSTTGSDAEF